jgi:hypothetical protein
MAARIGKKELERDVAELARRLGVGLGYAEDEIHLDGAYGGWRVFGRGYDVLDTGYVSKRELSLALGAALAVLDFARRRAPVISNGREHMNPPDGDYAYGKFPDRLAEALYSGDFDQEDGDVTDFGLWFGLVRSRGRRGQAYIVTEDSQGFVEYERYDTAAEAEARFEELQNEYSDWLEQEEKE